MSREKYGMIWDCYHCKRGTEHEIKECPNHAYNRSIEECQWKRVKDNDLLKIANGNRILTFPALEEIIKEEGIKFTPYTEGEKE